MFVMGNSGNSVCMYEAVMKWGQLDHRGERSSGQEADTCSKSLESFGSVTCCLSQRKTDIHL